MLTMKNRTSLVQKGKSLWDIKIYQILSHSNDWIQQSGSHPWVMYLNVDAFVNMY